jgi:hypothetical protein
MRSADRARRSFHHALGGGMECLIRLADEVADAKAHHLFDRQAFAFAKCFQSVKLLIRERDRKRCHDRLLRLGD